MKLREAISIGRFCGLMTVEECLRNVEYHYWNVIPYDQVPEESKELYEEYQQYLDGNLEIDFDAIDAENEKAYAEMIASDYGNLNKEEEVSLDFTM